MSDSIEKTEQKAEQPELTEDTSQAEKGQTENSQTEKPAQSETEESESAQSEAAPAEASQTEAAEKSDKADKSEKTDKTESSEEIEKAVTKAEQTILSKIPDTVATAPRCENPVKGRKVFFVNPPIYVEKYVQLELKQHEYEVYIIPDYKYAKNALRHFPDALCFIFIDDELTYDEWCNFIRSFQDEDVLKTIFVGLLSASITKPKMEKFIMTVSLPGGFILLNEFKGSALTEKIVGILDLNGAKGIRKYVRLDCGKDDTPINGYFATKSQLLQVSIINISSVGFVCYYPVSYGEILKNKTLVPSFSITLGRRSIVTPSVVFETKRMDATRLVSIMLFSKQVGEEDRKIIKNYIFEQLQERFEKLVFSVPPDIEDYSNRNPRFLMAAAPASEAPAAGENAENVENAEPVEDAEELTEEVTETENSETENKASEKTEATENPEATEASESSEAKPSEEK